jgi:hypothetical protein
MGFVWNPTGLEAGIDGYIEIRDVATGHVTNWIIQVQSKATDREFQAETAEGFDYYCDPRDLEYWLGGNAPVILICSRPATNEAYWVSIKDYFKDLSRRGTRKVHFDKNKDRCDAGCREDLIRLAKPRETGIYLAPLPKVETLYSNLLEVQRVGERIYVAETDIRSGERFWKELRKRKVAVGDEWILKDKRIISFHDLTEYPWNQLCEQGTVEDFDVDEWALADEPDIQRDFVRLLNLCLKERLRPDVIYHKKRDHYFFAPTPDLSPRILSYKSLVHNTARTVFQGYPSKKDPNRMAYYRHSAFEGQFLRADSTWYLEITPTYHFTRDGQQESVMGSELLKGIKRLERNPAVFGQVLMWATYLEDRWELFSQPYPFLGFGKLVHFPLGAGLDDDVWLGSEDADEVAVVESPANQLALFDEVTTDS